MNLPPLLDLYCCAGGAAEGYRRAGWTNIVGVDHNPQPRYPFTFVQADALEYLEEHGHRFGFIHASPPCQRFSVTRSLHDKSYPDLVGDTRDLLILIGAPYVIENVPGAPLIDPVKLCGTSFGLGVRRHRLFETSPTLIFRLYCYHNGHKPVDVTGTGGPGGRHNKPRNVKEAQEAMGIDWMTRPELNQAIPPAYTEWIGRQMIKVLEATP